MQLPKESCACGHPLDHHDGGHGGPCNHCGCSAGEAPTAFQTGLIHSLHELTSVVAHLLKEVQTQRGQK